MTRRPPLPSSRTAEKTQLRSKRAVPQPNREGARARIVGEKLARLSQSVSATRAEKAALRREAILEAAIEEFCAGGYANTRLDEVARRAGVAKGTIYLHFADKEALFQEIIRTMFVPVVTSVEHALPSDLPISVVLESIVQKFIVEVYGTRRREIMRLLITEGPRFPTLAEFHYETVVKRALGALRGLLEIAYARGEITNRALVEFPQLVVAPCLVAVIWSGLFERFAPLDLAAMMRAHLELLFVSERRA